MHIWISDCLLTYLYLDIETVQSSKPNLAKMKGDKEFLTIKDYVFPIGKTKPVVQLPEVKMQ